MRIEKRLKPAPEVARDFGVSLRSIERWVRNSSLCFPQPTKINRRNYFDADALEAWKAARLRVSTVRIPA
jgi:predicted DNA-binding transcriptional regulator AlpA